MFNVKSGLTIRTRHLYLALAWFLFTFYELTNGVMHNAHPALTNPEWIWVVVSDLGGAIGLAFRAVGGFIALITSIFYLVKRDLTSPEALLMVRLVVILEAGYWLSLIPSIIPQAWTQFGPMTIENNIPCTVESILLPIVLVIFSYLYPKKSLNAGHKVGLNCWHSVHFCFLAKQCLQLDSCRHDKRHRLPHTLPSKPLQFPTYHRRLAGGNSVFSLLHGRWHP